MIQPFYQDDFATIYHARCEDVLPYLEPVDLVLTDPPYGIGRDGMKPSTSRHGGRKAYEFLGWDGTAPPREVFEMIFKISKDQVIWGGNYFTPYLPPSMGWLVWDKGQRICNSDGELAFTSLSQALRVFTLNRVALMKDGAHHPTQKPLALLRWCLGFFPNAKTILDPFAGAGSSLRAAKDLGIKSIGVEINEQYCAIAAERLRQEVLWSAAAA